MKIRQLVRIARQNYHYNGFQDTFKKSLIFIVEHPLGVIYCRTIRRLLPTKGYSTYAGIKVPTEVAPKARVGDRYLPFVCLPKKERYKGYIRCLRRYASCGDDVVIVGGGRGVSTVVAAELVAPVGSVIVFEPSPEMINIIQQTLALNATPEVYDLRQTLIGPPLQVYTDKEIEDIDKTEELPQCDLLLLDCEGAEYEIIENLETRPQYVIIELHPDLVEHSPDAVLTAASQYGYEIIHSATYYGKPVTEKRLRELLARRSQRQPDIDGKNVKNPIVVFERHM